MTRKITRNDVIAYINDTIASHPEFVRQYTIAANAFELTPYELFERALNKSLNDMTLDEIATDIEARCFVHYNHDEYNSENWEIIDDCMCQMCNHANTLRHDQKHAIMC